MKKLICKKAQVYGLSTFIYALAIAVVLIVGLIGMSKEFEARSNSANYQFNAISATKTAEVIKKVLEQERGYTLDKSLYFLGAFGGFMPNEASVCPSRQNTDFDFLPEKNISYWQYGALPNCIPSDSSLINSLSNYGNNFFSKPDNRIMDLISTLSGKTYNIDYFMKISNYSDSTIEVSWFPHGITNYFVTENGVSVNHLEDFKDITINFPLRNPNIQYSFEPFVHSLSKTPFFALKHLAETFVKKETIHSQFNNSNNFPFVTVVDDDALIGVNNSATVTEKNCKTDAFPSAYCTQNSSEPDRSFKVLVDYVAANYPATPLNLDAPDDCAAVLGSAVSSVYTAACTIYTSYNSGTGTLVIDKTKGTNGFAGCTSGNTNDDKAMKCVMMYQINKLMEEKNRYGPSGASYDWKVEFESFNLTYKGYTNASFLVYNR